MTTHSSAQECLETPHATNSITNNTISNTVRRRAHSLINDRTIDANERVWIRYALETNDAAGLAELIRRADAGEPIIDDSHVTEVNEETIKEKLGLLAEIMCEAGSQPEERPAALLVLMSILENSEQPRVLANHVKHIAFTRCSELNCYGVVDAQIARIESELLASTTVD
jgi:hypothetical protein